MPKQQRPKQKNPESDVRVVVKLPEEIVVDLVPSNDVRSYEIFFWLFALMSPIAVGFWTAYFTAISDLSSRSSFWWSAVAFTMCSIMFLALAAHKRKNLYKNGIKKIQRLGSFE